MTEKEFVIWLHGFLEISGATSLDEKQLQVIKDHLNTFFTKVTPNREKKKDDDHVTKQIDEFGFRFRCYLFFSRDVFSIYLFSPIDLFFFSIDLNFWYRFR
jgi:hypothetical protein